MPPCTTPADQVTVQGLVPPSAAWIEAEPPGQIDVDPETLAVGLACTLSTRTGDEVLVLKLALPLYSAVRLWLADDSDEVVNVATPDALSGMLLPITVEPSLKLTVPVGTPAPGATAATVAVSVTGWPAQEGLSEEASVVAVAALLTTCGSI